jgi:hypothetical protein
MITLRFDPNHLRGMIYLYEKKMPKVYTDEARNMNYTAAKELKMLLISNIMSEKFAGLYPELSKPYADWKEKHGGQAGFWKLWGSLVSSISVRETPKGYSVGIEKNMMPIKTSSMGKKSKLTPVWMYAWYGEYSHRQRGIFHGIQPSRPVFRPTYHEYYVMFMDKRRKDALDKIKAAW